MNITNIIDVLIVLTLATWMLTGFKRGVVKQATITIGTIIVFILAFILKNPLAEMLSISLPFFTFDGIFKGVTAINIVLYQILAFIIIVAILQIILNIFIKISSVIETVFKFTIVFGIPSKILGMILGLIEGFAIVFIALFFLTQPAFNIKEFENSKLTPKILRNIPVLSNVTSGINNTVTDIYNLGLKYKNINDSNTINREAINIMLKHKIVTVDYIEKLIQNKKIDIAGINTILNNYR